MTEIASRSPSLSWGKRVTGWLPNTLTLSEGRVVALGLLMFFFSWAGYEAIIEADKSLHHDLLEAYAWGKEFQLGYHQHGPFWAWVAGTWFLLFPNTNTSFILLEALNATLGLWGAWQLSGLFARGGKHYAATLLLIATPFYTIEAFKFNANTIFLSLWPWTLYFFVKSLEKDKKRDAVLFGLFAGLSVLSKYYAAILLLTAALSLIVHANGRRYILSVQPWISAGVFFVILLPHFIWSVQVHAPPVAYAISLTGRGLLFSIRWAVKFLLDCILALAPLAALVAVASRISKASPFHELNKRMPLWRRRFLAVLALAPPCLTVGFSLAFQLKIIEIMAVGTFPLMPLLLLESVNPTDEQRTFKLAGVAAIAITLLAVASAPFARNILAAKLSGSAYLEPRRELAARVTVLWHDATHMPLRYIGGADRYANAVSFYSEDQPSSFINLDYTQALWVTPIKLKRYGLLIACAHQDSECLGKAASFLQGQWKRQSVKLSRKVGNHETPEVDFDIFIIPPSLNNPGS